MENNSNFSVSLFAALESKTQWYDNEELPRLLENYRLLHTCVKNLFEFLVKKSLITPDPYKLDKKTSDIKALENSQFIETERSVIMGQRLSDYESMLDFLCNYYKFSCSNLNLVNLKKLADLNNSILWTSFTQNCNRINTRVLATIVNDGRQNSDALTSSMVNDSLKKASAALNDINTALKEVTEFQKEYYKVQVRKNVFAHAGYDANKAAESPAAELQQIKKNFTAGMGKVPFYNELIDEIIQEDLAPNKEELQNKVLEKLNVVKKVETTKEESVDTRAMLMETAHILGAMPPVLNQVVEKIRENHDVLESEHNSLFDKIKKAFRKAFNLAEKPLFYTIVLTDAHSGTKRNERLNYQVFVGDLSTKARRYVVLGQPKSAGYAKVLALPENKLLEFISAQITDCNKMLVMLNALDEFFKAAVNPANKVKIKGLKIDITTLKNTVLKANQHRAEYLSYVEEMEQMRKLGIK
jgi:hypothetical protein